MDVKCKLILRDCHFKPVQFLKYDEFTQTLEIPGTWCEYDVVDYVLLDQITTPIYESWGE